MQEEINSQDALDADVKDANMLVLENANGTTEITSHREKVGDRFRQFMTEELEGATLIEHVGRHMKWLVSRKKATLAYMFQVLEREKVGTEK